MSVRIGVSYDGMTPLADARAMAQEAEAAGVGSFWLAEHLGYRESIVSAMAVLATTERLSVIPTALSPFMARPMVTAMALATLAEAAPGRVALALGHRLVPPWRELPWMAVTGLLSVFGFNILVIIGQTLTEASKAAIIAYTMPAMTAALSVLLLDERLSGRRLAALGLGMAGIGVLASEDWAGLIAAPAGALVMLGSAFSWALGTVAMKAGRFTLAPMRTLPESGASVSATILSSVVLPAPFLPITHQRSPRRMAMLSRSWTTRRP